jgi:nucleoside-diphosphate-sugar epimerase
MPTRLVLGATGGVGHWVVESLISRGENVRVMVRDPAKISGQLPTTGIEIVVGDALNAADDMRSSSGDATIFHCVNVPYQEWSAKAIPMLENTVSAAMSNKAKIVFPGNVYVFGHARTDFVKEDHPMDAHTRKGKLRIRMEEMLAASWRKDHVEYTIVRMPDFYGPYVPNVIYADVFKNALSGKTMTWYGKLDIPFEFSYIQDAGEGMVIAGLDATTAGETYHLPGYEPTTPRTWLDKIAAEAGTKPKIRTISPSLVSLYGLVNPLAREFREMFYLREERLILDQRV